jgi:hypothetical protein
MSHAAAIANEAAPQDPSWSQHEKENICFFGPQVGKSDLLKESIEMSFGRKKDDSL